MSSANMGLSNWAHRRPMHVMTMRIWQLAVPLAMAAAPSFLCGQPQNPQPPQTPAHATRQLAFEVASIKPTPPEFNGSSAFAPASGNVLSLRGMSVSQLIQLAYTLPPNLVTGGPKWVEDTRFDLEAKAAGAATQVQRLEMLQTLLADRFKLKFHYESKEISTYVLTLGKNPLKLKERKPGDGGEPAGMRDIGSVHFQCRDMSMAWFVRYLQNTVFSSPVADQTGLSASYDFDLSWRPDEGQFNGRYAGSAEMQSDLPDLFTALKEIGLKLETKKSNVQFARIDYVEQPSEN